MKEVTLQSGKVVRLNSVTLEQADRWIDAIGARDRNAGRQLCIDAMNSANPADPMDIATFNRTMTPRDLAALVDAALEVSDLVPKGEATANG